MHIDGKSIRLSLLVFFLALCSANAQELQLRGSVVDAETGEPLVGATIMVKGSSKGVMTDEKGNYLLEKVSEGDTIVALLLGYSTQENILKGSVRVMNFRLVEEMTYLEDVVVIGYGTMEKKELTSAISHVSSKDFLSGNYMDPAMSIQGKVSGVSITNTGAADPNNSASIQIRGISSRAAGLGPLIVLDGVPGANMSNLNQNDIESIDVLKDGAASAIYGTRGSNGVILITTKKGSKDGTIHTSYEGHLSANVMIKELDMLTADEYREYKVNNGSGADYGGNVDWLEAVSRVGVTHSHTLTISGGNAANNYRVSADYRNATGIDRRSAREEYGARLSVNHKTASGLFSFSANLAPRIINAKAADWNIFHNAIEANPTTPIMDPANPSMYFSFFGQQAGYNPVEENETVLDDREIKLLDMDATARIHLGEGLSSQVTIASQQNDEYASWFRPSTNTEGNSKGWQGEASKKYDKNSQLSLEWLTNYYKTISYHNIKAMVGYSYQYFQYSGMSAENKNFPNDGITYNDLEQGAWAKEEGHVGMDSYKNDAKLIAFFGRISYDWKGKYLATASIRREGSSKFGANNKWGNFPAFSAGWRISEEPWVKANWINDLKIRADFGVTGNQDFSSYLSLNTMTGFGDYYYNGQWFTVWGPSRNVNPDLRWEKGFNWNVGVDFSLFNRNLSGSLNYFNRRQQDLLGDYNVPIPPYLYSTTFVNVGTMKNTGVEIDLNWKTIRRKDFSYTIDLVGSTMDNRFVSFSNSEYVGQNFYYVAPTEDPFPFHYLQKIQEGKRLGTYYMWKFAGVNKQGEWLVYDQNGDIIPALKAVDADMYEVGNGLPLFQASMTHSFRYKNFDLSLYFRGAFGFDIFNIHEFYYGFQDEVGNIMKIAFTKNELFKGNPVVCDYFLEKGDYLKLDMLSLGYTFDIKNKYVDTIRIYFTGRNLLTLTSFSGVDPSTYQVNGLNPGATGSRNYYPSCRQIMTGIKVDF